jgi:hypothetical protein
VKFCEDGDFFGLTTVFRFVFINSSSFLREFKCHIVTKVTFYAFEITWIGKNADETKSLTCC